MKSGIDLIKEERERQLSEEGWTPEHDKNHKNGELIKAAICYAYPGENINIFIPNVINMDFKKKYIFPFDPFWWKPTPDDRLKELAKAGALIAAEMDRIINQ